MNVQRRLLIACAAIAALVFAQPLAAQDRPPIVESEPIHATPVTPQPPMVTVENTDDHVVSSELPMCPEIYVDPPIVRPSEAKHTIRLLTPAPLKPMDTAVFEGMALPIATKFFGSADDHVVLPKMTKMFSFSTIDSKRDVANAIAQFDAELTMQLATPESVEVNQVFQQFVHIRNSGDTTQRAVRVTQVCDLTVLGAQEPQAVVIDCIEPGETKTVQFSARALQPGSFAVRYVAENAQGQADVDDVVLVEDAGLLTDFVGPSQMYAGDEAEFRISIRNTTADAANDLRIRCEISPAEQVEFQSADESEENSGIQERILSRVAAGQIGTTAMRFSALKSGRLRVKLTVDSNGEIIASRSMQITVVGRPR